MILGKLIANAQLTPRMFLNLSCSLQSGSAGLLPCCSPTHAVTASGTKHAALQNIYLLVTFINFHSSKYITEIILHACNTDSEHNSFLFEIKPQPLLGSVKKKNAKPQRSRHLYALLTRTHHVNVCNKTCKQLLRSFYDKCSIFSSF